ncbi:ABC transporter substrate-binding protein [Pseudalkalibacillus sp. R45]|uniref:ABC transporter substrate-binding protein n=1 Tax=Pseudalkalibacillus sp. R45 TaxID=3457433 RepID=UPI003FCE4A6F
MKKVLGVFLVMAMISCVLLTGCKSGDETTSENGEVTLKLWNRVNGAETYLTKLIESFEEENPNIKVELQNLSVESAQPQYQAAISNNELPDMFVRPPTTTVTQLVEIDRLKSLDSLFPQEVVDEYVEGVFYKGSNITAEGKIYAFPLSSGLHGTTMLYYNKDVLNDLDVEVDFPMTWDDLLEVGKEIHEKSDGKIYGMVLGAKSAWLNSSFISQMAFPISPDSGMDYATGNFNFATEGNIETIQFFKELLDNNVISPQSLESTSASAQALFASGQSAFIINGNWMGGILQEQFQFENWGAAPLPTKEAGTVAMRPYGGGATESIMVAKNTKHWEEVKAFLTYLREHIYDEIDKSGSLASAKIAEDGEVGFPQYKDIQQIMNDTNILVPNPENRNPAVEEVALKYQELAPRTSTGDIFLGYLAGQVKDLEGTLQKLTDDANKALEQAIESNDKVTKEDYRFSNWDPNQSYTEEDYEELKKK